MRMNQTQFEKLVESTLQSCRNLLITKGFEYAGRIDRLANFKRGANLTRCTPLQVALIYLSKHYDALATYIEDSASGRGRARSEPIEGRLDDLINYCLLMKALIIEEKEAGAVYASVDLSKEEMEAVEQMLKTGAPGRLEVAERIEWRDIDNQPELASCPFCGGKAKLFESHAAGSLAFVVGCMRCYIDGKGYALHDAEESKRKAIAFWNKRSIPQEVSDISKSADVTPEERNALLGVRHARGECLVRARMGERIGVRECKECGGRGHFTTLGLDPILCKCVIDQTTEGNDGRVSTDDAGAGAQA